MVPMLVSIWTCGASIVGLAPAQWDSASGGAAAAAAAALVYTSADAAAAVAQLRQKWQLNNNN